TVSDAADELGVAKRGPAGFFEQAGERRDRSGGSGPADICGADDGNARFRITGAAAVFAGATDGICRIFDGAGGGRNLRRGGLPGEPGDARAWHSDGAG